MERWKKIENDWEIENITENKGSLINSEGGRKRESPDDSR